MHVRESERERERVSECKNHTHVQRFDLPSVSVHVEVFFCRISPLTSELPPLSVELAVPS